MKAYDNPRIFEKTEFKDFKRELAELRDGRKSEIEALHRRIHELERELERDRANEKLSEKIASRLEHSIRALMERVEKLEKVGSKLENLTIDGSS